MNKKQVLLLVLIAAVLAFLVYLQVQHWRKFDWEKFAGQTEDVQWGKVAIGVLLVYLADGLRALRWAIFLKPVRKVRARDLVGTQFIGFTGLALFGRLGELLRPYLIARRTKLTLSSQLAVWTVERIFDMGAVTVLVSFALFSSRSVKHLEHYERLPQVGIALVLFVLGGIIFAALVRRYYARIVQWMKATFHRFPAVTDRLTSKVEAFGEGLNTLSDVGSFFACTALSLSIWLLISLSYFLITHAYPEPLNQLTWTHSILLMGFSVAGGVLQLPIVGGGSQFMTITALTYFYQIPNEMAVSCGILLWLATFMSVVPLGLIYAHLEQVSFTQLTREARKTEESVAH
jgi:glycosyltransferase 2 family protein